LRSPAGRFGLRCCRPRRSALAASPGPHGPLFAWCSTPYLCRNGKNFV
jgi:hypothetical protein